MRSVSVFYRVFRPWHPSQSRRPYGRLASSPTGGAGAKRLSGEKNSKKKSARFHGRFQLALRPDFGNCIIFVKKNVLSHPVCLLDQAADVVDQHFEGGAAKASCIGLTVVKYWVMTLSKLRPRSLTSRRMRRRIRSSASVSTKIL